MKFRIRTLFEFTAFFAIVLALLTSSRAGGIIAAAFLVTAIALGPPVALFVVIATSREIENRLDVAGNPGVEALTRIWFYSLFTIALIWLWVSHQFEQHL
jgi:hypothetical protein